MISSYWMTLLAAAGANFMWILLKALQQRNVAYGNYMLIVLVSYFLAAAEIIMVYTIATTGIVWPLVVVMGTSGGLGCLCAVKLHETYLKRKGNNANLPNPMSKVQPRVGRIVSLQGRSSTLSKVREHRDEA